MFCVRNAKGPKSFETCFSFVIFSALISSLIHVNKLILHLVYIIDVGRSLKKVFFGKKRIKIYTKTTFVKICNVIQCEIQGKTKGNSEIYFLNFLSTIIRNFEFLSKNKCPKFQSPNLW